MSLGWQTESALLPSKSKPIHIGDKSILQLKTLISQQEQQLKRNQKQSPHPHHRNHQHLDTSSSSSSSKRSVKKKQSKEGPTAEAAEEPLTITIEQRVQKSLEAKAKLYEELMNQHHEQQAISPDYPLLIDFDQKQRLISTQEKLRRDSSEQRQQEEEDEEDNDGEEERRREEDGNGERGSFPSSGRESKVTSEYGPAQWQWSTVNTDPLRTAAAERPDLLERKIEQEFRSLMDQKIVAELSNSSSFPPQQQISEAAKIKTQWEKTLQSTAKEFIEQVHQQTLQERSKQHQQHHQFSATATAASSEIGKRSLREEKLEMIKRKRLEHQNKL